jgi:NADH-quinone oxidoreductase E subunit
VSNGSAKLTIHPGSSNSGGSNSGGSHSGGSHSGGSHSGNGDNAAALTKAISAKAAERLAVIKKRYPDPKSAVMAALYLAQEEVGFINQTALEWVSAQLDMPLIHVQEVATFYTMYYKRPVGKYHFQVCRTLSCALRGSKQLSEMLHKRFHVGPQEVTADGMWSFEEVECLGSCGTAPMCEVNDHYFENLTPEKLEAIIQRIEKEKPDLRLSTVKDELGEGLKGHAKSEII